MTTFGVLSLSMRVYFSEYHLWGAKHFAALARSIEDAHKGRSRFSVKHRAYVTNCVLSSVAFLEALINEFFDDIEDGHLCHIGNLTDKQRENVAVFWTVAKVERASILDKFQIALVAVGAAPFNKGAAPFQDAAALVELRNDLVHFRAETHAADSKDQQNLLGKWQARFPPSKLMQGSKNPYYPDHLLGAGCAEWAVKSALALADEFVGRTGVNASYKTANFQDD